MNSRKERPELIARDEQGAAIIIVMAFLFVILAIGLALVVLLSSARNGPNWNARKSRHSMFPRRGLTQACCR